MKEGRKRRKIRKSQTKTYNQNNTKKTQNINKTK